MLFKTKISVVVLSILVSSESVLGRIRWLERDERPVFLHPRRFGQEHPAVIDKLSAACDGAVCGTLAGQAITPLLAAQGECTQQDMADQIIDAAQQFDDTTKANMIALAQEYRQAEKNTPPDFTTNPPTNRNSVFCQQAPKNSELNGLVQAQDPANDANTFFDPATKASVQKGSQPNTAPFGGAASNAEGTNNASTSAAPPEVATFSSAPVLVAAPTGASSADACTKTVMVTVTVSGEDANAAGAATTVSVGGTGNSASAVASSSASVTASDVLTASASATPAAGGNVGQGSTASPASSPAVAATQTAESSATQTNAAAAQSPAETGNGSGQAAAPPKTSPTVAQEDTKTTTAETTTAAGSQNTSGSNNNASGSNNLQTFSGSLGSAAPVVSQSGNQFQVEGNSVFNTKKDALVRSCDVQHNQCANAANASGNKGGLTVNSCDDQQKQCAAAAGN